MKFKDFLSEDTKLDNPDETAMSKQLITDFNKVIRLLDDMQEEYKYYEGDEFYDNKKLQKTFKFISNDLPKINRTLNAIKKNSKL